ncbi:MAG: pitrilysin family protein [Bacteroidetes bacterium]|nr:pitrilysin family protein [Bacteroidota bacterium]MDA1119233.1 pitrilysin family protein [Bacteroidota bacterium]
MINYSQFELANGLKVIVHQDKSTSLAAMNLLYNVGSRDEDQDKTGFAHLFEHLMFGGSKNIDNYDEPLQKVGGENNAFTTPDITNYYLTVPSINLETGFWLESDRMLSLSFSPTVLEVQRKVVIEEFKQRYLNQPYGDTWLKLRPLAYKTHPYQWATIGKEISHIENASIDDVREFFFKFYRPNNAILVVAGNVDTDDVKRLCAKYFEPIPIGEKYVRNLSKELMQKDERYMEIVADVPLNAFNKVFHMPARNHPDYHAIDLLCDLLGHGNSSRLYDQLVKKRKLFNSIGSFVTGSLDPGLFGISGKLNEGVSFDDANSAFWEVVEALKGDEVALEELRKVKNQAQTSAEFGEVELLNRAMNLATATVRGNPELVNLEKKSIDKVTTTEIQEVANQILTKSNCSTLYYKSKSAA